MSFSPLLSELIDALRCMPGVGPRSAQRIALALLKDRQRAGHLADVMARALKDIRRCRECRTYSEHELCRLCASPERDGRQLCIVESPQDVMAIEEATPFRGRYFVLHGRLSPLDNVGPDDLGLDDLEKRLDEEPVAELIIATNTTVEGEATAYYIQELAKLRGVQCTRIAHGVPIGGELEYVDRSTLAHAFGGRRSVEGET